jgi:preprotein translocase subunit SecG
METVVIVIHLMVIVALVAVVLLQRSEGGALGIGGGNAFLSTRGQGNVLTRATAILAAAFFATSIILTAITRFAAAPSSVLDQVQTPPTSAPAGNSTTTPSPASGGFGDILNQLDQSKASGGGTAAPATDGAASGTAPAPATAPAAPQVPTSQ